MRAGVKESHGWPCSAGRSAKPPGAGRSWRRAVGVALVVLATLLSCALVLSTSTPSLLWVQAPLEGDVIGVGGVNVRIRFPRERKIALETFVARLNGADVTEEFTTGSNGAIGRLHGVLDGENTLRFEIQGDRGGAPVRLLRDIRDVRFLVRQPQGIDRG